MNPEEIIYNYMAKVTNKILEKTVIPDKCYENVQQIDFEELAKIKEQFGIEGIILDIDGTLREDMKKIDYRNIKWIFKLKQMFKVCMVSNGKDKNVQKLADKLKITYYPFSFKPLKKGFFAATNQMQVDPKNVLVVGDEYLADIVGGKRMGMKTVLIKKQKEIEDR